MIHVTYESLSRVREVTTKLATPLRQPVIQSPPSSTRWVHVHVCIFLHVRTCTCTCTCVHIGSNNQDCVPLVLPIAMALSLTGLNVT